MKRVIKSFLVVVCGMVFTIVGGVTGYYLAFTNELESDYGTSAVMTEAKADIGINENTVLEFIYNYSDGFSETQQSLPQQFMYGWDRDKTQQAYSDWLMTEFSKDRVVFNKNIEGESPQHYILKENDGYVAVYYKDSGLLKETTSAPLAALSDEDRTLFEKGFEISGETNLIKYIESLET